MLRALSPEIFWQMAQYNIVDSVVIAAVLFFGIGGRLKLQSYYGQPLTILTSAVLVALAAVSEFTSWLHYLPVLATAGLPVLAAHPDGYVVFQAANMLGIYQALSNQFSVIVAAQVLCRAISMLSTLDQPKINFIGSIWNIFTFATERKLFSKDNITLEDIPQHPKWLITATSKEIILDSNQPYFVIQAIVRAVWKLLVPLYILLFLIESCAVAKVYMHGQVLCSLDAPHISLYHGAYSILMCAVLSNMSHAERQIKDYIDYVWEYTYANIETQIQQQPLKAGYQHTSLSLININISVGAMVRGLNELVVNVHRLLITILTLWSVYQHIGYLIIVPFVIDFVCKIALYTFNVYIPNHARIFNSYNVFKDNRVIKDVYKGIRAIKLFGWEQVYLSPQKHKKYKTNILLNVGYNVLNTMINTIRNMKAEFSSLIIIYIHFKQQNSLSAVATAANIYQITFLVSNLHIHISTIFNAIFHIAKIKTAHDVIKSLYSGGYFYTLPQMPKIPTGSTSSVVMNDCSFTRNERLDTAYLKNISLQATAGDIVAIAGSSGSGKSMMLLAMCGEKKMLTGTGQVTGRVAYLEQPPFIMNDTIRANILFGREMDKEQYQQVVYACALNEDIEHWPSGDLTLIGEQGINISGGQRARLALARTLYAPADVYILDDPLSAVDAHVKRHIMEHVLLDTGMLQGKLRIIAANTEHILPFASQVMTMNDGQAIVNSQTPATYSAVLPPLVPRPLIECKSTVDLATSTAVLSSDVVEKSKVDQPREWPMWSNIKYLIDICGWPAIFMVMMVGMVNPVLQFIVNHYILSALHTENNQSINALLMFFCSSVAYSLTSQVVTIINTFIDQIFASQLIEKKINQAFITGVIHAPLSYFDGITESSLENAYDDGASQLVSQLTFFIQSKPAAVVGALLSLYQTVGKSPYLLLIVLPTALLGNMNQNSFTRVYKILEKYSEMASEKYSVLNSIIKKNNFLIRIFGVEKYFSKTLQKAKEMKSLNYSLQQNVISFNRLYTQNISLMANMIHYIAVCVYCSFTDTRISSSEYTYHGNILTSIGTYINQLLNIPVEILDIMTNVNILRNHATIAPEAPYICENRPAADWPSQGLLEISNLSLKYRPDLDYALKNINLSIKAGEKIGIVGRTGAGKSTLAKALFRLIPEGITGSVKIDGLETADIGVGDLRPRLGIIPQESAIFQGSVRENLDPSNSASVEDIWATLIKCNAAQVVAPPKRKANAFRGYVSDRDKRWQNANIKMKLFLIMVNQAPFRRVGSESNNATQPLDQPADITGCRLSNGQQQLFSLCRMIMHHHKVIVLDEATAQVDLKTDSSIQQVVRKEFADCTVLTIAHRLETIMSSDRIIVMDKGQIAEIGPPQQLLQSGGYFAELVKANDFGQYAVSNKKK